MKREGNKWKQNKPPSENGGSQYSSVKTVQNGFLQWQTKFRFIKNTGEHQGVKTGGEHGQHEGTGTDKRLQLRI